MYDNQHKPRLQSPILLADEADELGQDLCFYSRTSTHRNTRKASKTTPFNSTSELHIT